MSNPLSVRRASALSLVLCLVVAMALPALSKPGASKGKKKGKRAIGSVTAFDPATMQLSVEFRDGSTFEGSLAEDAKIKLEHRGKPAARGNPTKGSVDDIDVGDKVLKMKARNGEVRKLRLRDVASEVEDANGGECKDAEEEPAGEEPVEEEVVDGGEEVVALNEDDPVLEEVEDAEGDEDSEADSSCADKVEQSDDSEDSDAEEEDSLETEDSVDSEEELEEEPVTV